MEAERRYAQFPIIVGRRESRRWFITNSHPLLRAATLIYRSFRTTQGIRVHSPDPGIRNYHNLAVRRRIMRMISPREPRSGITAAGEFRVHVPPSSVYRCTDVLRSSPLANCADWLHRQIVTERPRLPWSFDSAYSCEIYLIRIYVNFVIFQGTDQGIRIFHLLISHQIYQYES